MPSVTIVGGGLSGMIAALRLRQRGCDVLLIEAADRLGGQAGAGQFGEYAFDHSYHIFPPWYANAWALIDELGIRDNFIASPNFSQLVPGAFPKFATFENLTAPRFALRNIFAGALSPAEMFLFFYATVDLMGQPYRVRSALDQVSVTGFLRSRWYRTLPAASQMHDLVLKGLSTPLYGLSAMTMQTTMRHWVWHGVPSLHLTRSDLQRAWIQPIEEALRSAGVEIRTGATLRGLVLSGGTIEAIRIVSGNAAKGEETLPVDTLLLALPVGVVNDLIDDRLYRAAPAITELRRLQTLPMGAFHLVLRRRIPEIPAGIVSLKDSSLALSFIDLAHSCGLEHSVLSFVVGDVFPIAELSADLVSARIVEEIRAYIPAIAADDIVHTHLQTHVDQPLFLNYVGAWASRPDASTQISNLFLAGDYCRSWVDLVTQEAALVAGLEAAEAVRRKLAIAEPIEIRISRVPPRWLWRIATFLLLPVALIARLCALIAPRTRG